MARPVGLLYPDPILRQRERPTGLLQYADDAARFGTDFVPGADLLYNLPSAARNFRTAYDAAAEGDIGNAAYEAAMGTLTGIGAASDAALYSSAALPFMAVPGTIGKVGSAAARKALKGLMQSHRGPPSKRVMRKSMDEMAEGLKVEPLAGATPKRAVTPEDMLGKRLLPIFGDRTAVGTLAEIGGQPLSTKVDLQGGMDYSRYEGGWASNQGAARTLQNRVDAVGGDVVGVYSPMSPDSGDFSAMMSEAALQMLDTSKVFKKDIKAFNKAVRAKRPEFVGVDSPELAGQLALSGPVRTEFIKIMDAARWEKAGFPDVAELRHAITDPALVNLPRGDVDPLSGQTLFSMYPGASLGETATNKTLRHTTYDANIPGDYVGGVMQPVPRSLWFPQFDARQRAKGAKPAEDYYTMQKQLPVQEANQEWLDPIMAHIEKAKAQPYAPEVLQRSRDGRPMKRAPMNPGAADRILAAAEAKVDQGLLGGTPDTGLLGGRKAAQVDEYARYSGMDNDTLPGEFFLDRGTANYADGDIGDFNHEAIVVHDMGVEVGDFANDVLDMDLDDFGGEGFDITDIEAVRDTLNGMDKAEVDALFTEHGMTWEKVDIAAGIGDARAYGIKELGYMRVAGNNVELHQLTPRRMRDLADGLADAAGDAEGLENMLFNIEDSATGAFYENVPFDVIESGQMKALRDFKK